MLSVDDIRAARARIQDAVLVTPCMESAALSDRYGFRIYCKMEYLQRTGSFKERGACNALLSLDDAARQRGVIAASAGNHAQGLAWHGRRLGVPVTVVMPTYAPLVKSASCTRFGARVIRHGESFADARKKADDIAAAEGLTYVHGFDDAAVIAGQGTLGLEVLEQVPHAAAVIVPAGGCGLLAGVVLAIKSTRPDVQVIAVESENTPNFSSAMKAGKPVTVPAKATLADGLATGRVGERAFGIAKTRVDRVITVREADIALSVLRLMELEKSVVEGSAAASLAAVLSGQLDDLKGRPIVLLLCGGNIDPLVLSRLIEKGLAADGRLCRLRATISDRPGGLAAFTAAIAATGAGIVEIQHDRTFSGADVSSTTVLCTIETHDADHATAVFDALEKFNIKPANGNS